MTVGTEDSAARQPTPTRSVAVAQQERLDFSQWAGEDATAYEVRLVAEHIARQLAAHREELATKRSHTALQGSENDGASRAPPLFVGLQGPQGSGKTTLTSRLSAHLGDQKNGGLKLAVFSMDDLYLPYEGLKEVASANPSNVLLEGRGQPGTHDLPLGSSILSSLRSINDGNCSASRRSIHLPIFDKSAHAGYGDRAKETVEVTAPLDVVVFEGWSLGFAPVGADAIRRKWKEAREKAGVPSEDEEGDLSLDAITSAQSDGARMPYFALHPLQSLLTLDALLQAYVTQWYHFLDVFVQLEPVRLDDVFEWRLGAERWMKERNGGMGMSDEQVRAFVARYMPGYELFSQGVQDPKMKWHGKGLKISVDKKRAVTKVDTF